MPPLKRLAPAILLVLAATAQEAPQAIFDRIEAYMTELSGLTGLKVRKTVPAEIITRDKVNEFVRMRLKEVSTPEDLRAEELVLKKFGFAPPEFDLAKTTVDLLTEQAEAFYDYNKRKLFITDWTPSETRDVTLVHELAHALADQNFNLEKFVKGARKSDDAALARLAVVEGQASWLMSEHLAKRVGVSLRSAPGGASMLRGAADAEGGQYPVFDQAPRYFRETLMFPYNAGMQFQHAVIEKLGDAAFAEVFRNPPLSAQHILHPETYFEHRIPTSPALPEMVSTRGYRTLIEGRVGELDHGILLREYAGSEDAARIAPHWRGGRYMLYERKSDKRTVLAYASEWDSEETARSFFRLYLQVQQKKWKMPEGSPSSNSVASGLGADGYFLTRVDGARVSSLEGLEAPRHAKGAIN